MSSWIGHRGRPVVIAAGTVGALLATTAVIVYAATNSSVIYACVNPTSKVLTLSTQTATCPKGGTKISWNQAGTPGMVWMGTWQSGTTYQATDAVFYPPTGSSYILPPGSGPTTAVPPASPWQLLAAQGLSHGYATDAGTTTPSETVDGPRLPAVTPPGSYIVTANVYAFANSGATCQLEDTDGVVASNIYSVIPVSYSPGTVITAALTIPPTASSTDTIIVRCSGAVGGNVIAIAVNALN